jgi:hypothetical protein
MDETRLDTAARALVQLLSRRTTLRSIGVAGIGSSLASLALDRDNTPARKKKKRKKCKPPKGKCGKKCRPLNTSANCGRCSNRCRVGEMCRDGVCCATPLCRGECRPECPPPTANREFPQALDYGAIQPTGSQSQLNADVEAAYDKWKARYLVGEARDDNGHQVFRIALGKPGTNNSKFTVSEGQGYGMVITAIMAGHDDEAQEIFDGLWRFRLAHPSEIDARLMDWKVPEASGNNSAFDGDADIAYGLLLANAQWGSNGLIDYQAAALDVIAGIKASTIGQESNLPMLGDWVQLDGQKFNQDTPRTSDFMLGHFRAFGYATGDEIWDSVIVASQDVIDTLQAEFSVNADPGGPDLTGLLPDFAIAGPNPAPPGFLEGQHDGDYNYNAGRDPWRLGTDALLNSDAASTDQVQLITNWAIAVTGGDPTQFRAGYRLDGTTWNDTNYFTTFFVAPLGVAAMTDPDLQEWLDAIYASVRNVQEDYFEDTVTLLCLLVMTGNFWDPTLPA